MDRGRWCLIQHEPGPGHEHYKGYYEAGLVGSHGTLVMSEMMGSFILSSFSTP